jgi:hypothetical protein
VQRPLERRVEVGAASAGDVEGGGDVGGGGLAGGDADLAAEALVEGDEVPGPTLLGGRGQQRQRDGLGPDVALVVAHAGALVEQDEDRAASLGLFAASGVG